MVMNILASVADLANYLLFVFGLAAGGAGIWLLLRSRIKMAYERAKAEGEAERAALAERLQGRDQQILDLKASAETIGRELAGIRESLALESASLAAAERSNQRIPALEEALKDRESQVAAVKDEIAALKAGNSALQATIELERKANQEKLALLGDATLELSDAFKALSADALKSNNESFMDLAKTTLEKFQQHAVTDLDTRQKAIDELVRPLKDSLQKVDCAVRDIEIERVSAYTSVTEQLKSVADTQNRLQSETGNLVKALRAPTVRGRWGEMQLRRVAEISGMIEMCDFVCQHTVDGDSGRLRPDMVVRLPNDREIVVDAKAPLQAYIDSLEAADDQTRLARLKDHARQVRAHVTKLGEKGYWQQFERTPEFVLLFLPGESFYGAALEQAPGLTEFALERRVILATPTTLIALLKAVAYGWNQERLAQNAEEISNLGKTLYERLRKLAEHLAKVGRSLEGTVKSYNEAVGSLDNRVLPAARRFRELGAGSGDEIDSLEEVDTIPRRALAG